MGILNGINTDAWNPASDNFLKVQYSANDMQGKAENKAAMRRDLVLSSADDQWPVVGCITRLVPQKGVHLIKHAIYRTLEMGNQFELLGSCPVPHIQVNLYCCFLCVNNEFLSACMNESYKNNKNSIQAYHSMRSYLFYFKLILFLFHT